MEFAKREFPSGGLRLAETTEAAVYRVAIVVFHRRARHGRGVQEES